MESLQKIIIEKVENLTNEKITRILKMTNGQYNTVYKVETNKNNYIFRIFRSENWPEDGKLEFINSKLIENNVECAKIILINRKDSYFTNGFMLEECIRGHNAKDVLFHKISGNEYYSKLAVLMNKIHTINIENYGHINNGTASYTTFNSFIDHECNRALINLGRKNIFSSIKLIKSKKLITDNLNICKDLPSVLCHNDITSDNVMINEQNNLVLIDWDNATSSNVIWDFSNMTYWMKLKYSDRDYEQYRNTFLDNYPAIKTMKNLLTIERAFHLLKGIKLLGYFCNDTVRFNRTLKYVNEVIELL